MVALALALGVYPATLLTPDAADGTEQVAVTGMAEKLDAEWLWYWLCAHEPIDPGVDTIQFQMAPLPPWQKRQMLANIKYVTAKFGADGGLAGKAEAGETE